MEDSLRLKQLKPGESGVIAGVGSRSGVIKRRLIDMGLTPGTRIEVVRTAPIGDPLEVRLRGYELSLRKEDAELIKLLSPGEETAYAGRRGRGHGAGRPDRATLRRMERDHAHERREHPGPPPAAGHDERDMKIALVGNPNSGKTTLFNALTGSSQYVGNWPGVTVEKKEGRSQIAGRSMIIVDLPGIYSLSPYSMEEIVARDFIIRKRPDAIINIVDATNIERNLYLTVQLLELERPMVVALNFMDEVEKRGDRIDAGALSKTLGVPVVPITAKTGENLAELLNTAHRQMHTGNTMEPDDLYDDFTHEIHHRIGELIHDRAYAVGLPAHWASIKLLEGDSVVLKELGLDPRTAGAVDAIAEEYGASAGLGDRETLIADSRYGYISRIVRASVTHGVSSGLTLTEKIDRVATHRLFAVPLFLFMMFLMFTVTFGPFGSMLSDGVGSLMDALSEFAADFLGRAGAAEWLASLVSDGIITGVGGVLTFLPQIALLFFFLSLLEDSGYMARAAFIMDRLLRCFGLSGKAFIPMIMGFGCSVPAIMGARTMENDKDRRMTILLVPFMSCSAKLPVYGLISAAFFGAWAGVAVFALYMLGMVMAVLSGVIFKKTLFSGEPAAFVMELPPYRLPGLGSSLRHVWEKVRGFLVKAGTLILLMSLVLWFLQRFNTGLVMVDDASESMLSSLGGAIAPIFRPMGYGTWQAAVALLTGLIAKEAVVASLSMFFGFSLTAGNSAVAAALSGTFASPLAAFAFLVFVLLYVPCVAAVSTVYKEMKSVRWTLLSVGWQLAVAYAVSFAVYSLGKLAGLA